MTQSHARVPGSVREGRQVSGFTLIELLVVIAIISIIAGFLVPTLLKGRGEAYKVQCGNNLTQIHRLSLMYSDKFGTNAFPIGPGKQPPAHESLNVLLEADSEGITPKLFKCPEGGASPAEVDPQTKKFVLDEETLDYAWTAKRLKNTSSKPLSSDKYMDDTEHDGHKKGMNVVMTDGQVSFINDTDPILENDEKLPEGLTR